MDRALAYLLAVRLKNSILRVFRKPTRLAGIALLILVFGSMAYGGRMAAPGASAGGAEGILVAVLLLYLLLAVLGGIGEPGLGFLPADMDYVLPGPFRRRQILAYHLGRQYGQILVLGLLYIVFLGAARLPRPGQAYLGTVLCLAVAAHLQAATTLLAGRIGDHLFGRLRRLSRIVVIGVLLVAATIAIIGLAGSDDVTALLSQVITSKPAAVLFYPAVAAGHVAVAPDLATALPSLIGLGVSVAVSFLLVLAFPVNVVETTVVTAADRRRQLAAAKAPSGRPGRAAGGIPGAAAVAWLNTLLLRRRLRMVVGLVVVLLVVLLASGRRGSSATTILVVLAFLPLVANLPLGFRGFRDHLESMKTLPLSPVRLALAQVAVPATLVYAAQAAVLVVYTALERLDPLTTLGALASFPILDVGVFALIETFTLGRDPRQASFLWSMLQMLAILLTLVPAVAVAAVAYGITSSIWISGLVGVGVHLLVVTALVRLLGWRFARWEPGQDDA